MPPETGSNSAIGVVLVANGDVFLRSEAGTRQVQSGAEVFQGEELVTGQGSNAEIRFADDTLLSQGADSVIALDDYIFDPEAADASTLLFKMSQGTFRMVTGKIAEQNPERFQIGTPLATIGIRGTTTVHEILSGGEEKHGVEEIHSGKALLIQSIDGEIRIIDSPQALVDIAASGQLGTVRPMTVQEFNTFREIAPAAIRQEQDIMQEREQDQQDDAQDNQGASGQGEDDQQAGQEGPSPEGGETGNMQIAGEGVLEPGVAEIISGPETQGEEGMRTAVNEAAMGFAEQVFEAVAEGDLAAANESLGKLDQLPTDDEILDLLNPPDENVQETDQPSDDTTDSSTTTSSGGGISYILGTDGDDVWEGTENTDYYDGLGGNDYISGMESGDGLRGNTGNDTVYGNCGDDTVEGGAGDDFLYGGKGADTIDGGDGIDILGFSDMPSGVDAYIGGGTASSTVSGTVETDTFSNIEGLQGSGYDDTLSGSDSNNTFYGSGGNDMISGLGGENSLSYEFVNAAVNVDLLYVVAVKSYSSERTETDILHDINHVTGTSSADAISGNENANSLNGSSGNDYLSGLCGDDTLRGGAGADILSGDNGSDYYYYGAQGEGGDTVNFISGDKFAFSSGSVYDGAGVNIKDNYDGSSGSTSGEEFIYDRVNDRLWYDADGSGSGEGELLATLTDSSVVLSDSDIAFV